MKVITASTIGNLISAHIEGDEKKFLAYANFIADAYDEAGEEQWRDKKRECRNE